MTDITLTFGKHKGLKLSQVSTDYVKWLSDQATICGKQDVPQAAREFLKSHAAEKPVFAGHIGYQGAYVSADEQEEAWREDRIVEQEADDIRAEHCILEWRASTGQEVEVWVWSRESITVKVGHTEYGYCALKPVPTSEQARAKALGIVCKLGPIGLTAERKSAVEAAMRKF